MKNQTIYALLSISIFAACASSGPLKTEIDPKLNTVVTEPKDFQSPLEALSLTNDPNIKSTLLKEHSRLQKELSTTNQIILTPGQSYEFELESFCVHPGISRPVVGDGLFMGEITGSPKSWLETILKTYSQKNVSQSDAQVLIWELLRGYKFDQLSPEAKTTALKIFPNASTFFRNSQIEASAKDLLSKQLGFNIANFQDQLQYSKEELESKKASFQELENILSPKNPREKPIPVGWIQHPDGYQFHLESNSYSQVKVKIYAPNTLKKPVAFNPTSIIAIPSQGQRLALSNIIKNPYEKFQTNFKRKTTITPAEAAFIIKHPLDAVKISNLADQALFISQNYVGGIGRNDSVDAMRHFCWSALITHSIGPQKALEYLTAHEAFGSNPAHERKMDMHNNHQGINFAKNYQGTEKDFENELIRTGALRLSNKTLIH